jgi:tRNA 2-thiouridine synthesizing protein E
MAFEFNGTTVDTDEEGYIQDISIWSPELAEALAKDENIEMTEDHWEVVNFLRNYYEEYQIAPAVRVLIKAIKKSLGPDKGRPARSPGCPSRPAASDPDRGGGSP